MTTQPGHRWFAAFWDWMTRHEPAVERRVREEIAGGAKGIVLEIGCGVGANFPYYTDLAEHITATEPDPYMLERAEKRRGEAKRPLEIRQASAEELPFPDASFDSVVSTLNMCTIPRPRVALAEIRRVLKSDGEYRFYDHVRYDNRFAAFWQDAVTPAWRWMGASCHLNRPIARYVQEAGFNFAEFRSLTPVPPVPPMICARPHIAGVACPV